MNEMVHYIVNSLDGECGKRHCLRMAPIVPLLQLSAALLCMWCGCAAAQRQLGRSLREALMEGEYVRNAH